MLDLSIPDIDGDEAEVGHPETTPPKTDPLHTFTRFISVKKIKWSFLIKIMLLYFVERWIFVDIFLTGFSRVSYEYLGNVEQLRKIMRTIG